MRALVTPHLHERFWAGPVLAPRTAAGSWDNVAVLDISVHMLKSMTWARQEVTTEVQRSAIVARQVVCFQIVLSSQFFSEILPLPFLSTAFLLDSKSVSPCWKSSACISNSLSIPFHQRCPKPPAAVIPSPIFLISPIRRRRLLFFSI